MENIYNSVIYPFLKDELTIINNILKSTGATSNEREEALLQWISNKNFTILGLYAKAPKYDFGIEIYQEFYGVFTPTGEYKNLAVKENFSDIIAPRMIQIPIQIVDNDNNRIYIGGDFTDEIFIGTTMSILDSSNNYIPLLQNQVSLVSYIDLPDDVTMVEFPETDLSGVVTGDILYFQKGHKLVGIDSRIEWYDLSGNVILEKTFKERFEAVEAANIEFQRRQVTINQMINLSDGTAVQPFVKAIYEYFKEPYIDNYIQLGKAKELKDAIDATTTSNEPVIGSYLDIQIPVTDIEGNTQMKMIRNWMKDDLYEGYK